MQPLDAAGGHRAVAVEEAEPRVAPQDRDHDLLDDRVGNHLGVDVRRHARLAELQVAVAELAPRRKAAVRDDGGGVGDHLHRQLVEHVLRHDVLEDEQPALVERRDELLDLVVGQRARRPLLGGDAHRSGGHFSGRAAGA